MGLGSIFSGIYQGISAGKRKREAQKEEQAAKEEYDRMKEVYSNVDTSNPFEGMINQYAGLENTMEDLTVNKQQAEFEAQQFSQSQANVLSGLRGAAGSSGIAALAQTLAKQGQIAAQKASASIGAQEAANQKAEAAMAGKLQEAEARGQADVDKQIATGEQMSQQLEMKKQATLMDMANQQYTSAQAATDQAARDQEQGISTAIGGTGDLLGSAIGLSDKRLKKNIKLIGKSPSGLKIYAFEYIDKFFGEHTYQGVMSDEIPNSAVVNNGGYDRVDYSKIDVEFKIL